MVFCRPPKKFRRELVKIRRGDSPEISRGQAPCSKTLSACQSLVFKGSGELTTRRRRLGRKPWLNALIGSLGEGAYLVAMLTNTFWIKFKVFLQFWKSSERQMATSPNGNVAKWQHRQTATSPNGNVAKGSGVKSCALG